jgi:hypothetical protein
MNFILRPKLRRMMMKTVLLMLWPVRLATSRATVRTFEKTAGTFYRRRTVAFEGCPPVQCFPKQGVSAEQALDEPREKKSAGLGKSQLNVGI